MPAPTAIRECGTVPTSAFNIVNEEDLLLDSVSYSPTRRETRYTQSGEIKGARYDQPEMTVSFSGLITGTGTSSNSTVTKGVGTEVTTALNNFANGTAVHEHDSADGCVVFLNPVRTVTEDASNMTFDLLHLPHAS
jgi:hypothetical protein